MLEPAEVFQKQQAGDEWAGNVFAQQRVLPEKETAHLPQNRQPQVSTDPKVFRDVGKSWKGPMTTQKTAMEQESSARAKAEEGLQARREPKKNIHIMRKQH